MPTFLLRPLAHTLSPLARIALALLMALAGLPLSVLVPPGSSLAPTPVHAAPYLVTSTQDSGPGSLRQAIADANAASGADTITFSPLLSGSIGLTSTLSITDAAGLTIDAQGRNIYLRRASSGFPLFAVNAGLELTGLTIVGGAGVSTIDNRSTLRVVNSILSFNTGNSTNQGGAIYNGGTLTVVNSTFNNNVATQGGVIFNAGTLTVVNSTLSGNQAIGKGGAIYNEGTLTVVNSTLSGNSATTEGGAIFNNQSGRVGSMTILNSTISANSARMGGGIFNLPNSPATITNTLLAGNTGSLSGPDCGTQGNITSGGHNLIGNTADCSITAGAGDLLGTAAAPVNPLLGALGDHGGSTFTHALLPGSPARDAGDNAACASALTVNNLDQRGEFRPFNGDGVGAAICDIGAYEAHSPAPDEFVINYLLDDLPDAVQGDGACWTATQVCTLRAAVEEANALPGAQRATFSFSGSTSARSQLIITDPAGLTRDGAGQEITIGRSTTQSVFFVNAGSLELRHLTMVGGQGTSLINNNRATLTVVNSTLRDSNSTGFGGAIRTLGTATIINSTLSGNLAVDDGGAIYNQGTLTVINSTLSANSTSGEGGAIHNNGGTLTVVNSTLSGNLGGDGGAIFNSQSGKTGRMTVLSSTITGNTAGVAGGGVYNSSDSPATITNTILAGNTSSGSGPDCTTFSSITSGGHNLVGDMIGCNITAVAGDLLGPGPSINPLLGPLADNGGPTFTHALQTGSPAIDAGSPAGCFDMSERLVLDQRGQARHIAGTIGGAERCDIGAFELVPAGAPLMAHADEYQVAEDEVLSALFAEGVLANDAGAPATIPTTVTLVENVTSGTLILNLDGGFQYSPNPNFSGDDHFTYRATEDTGATSTAQVTITVTPVEDSPTAVDDTLTTVANTANTVNVLTNDSDIDSPKSALTIEIGEIPNHGTILVNHPAETITYTPDPGFTGPDSFTYRVSDGVSAPSTAGVNVTVNAGSGGGGGGGGGGSGGGSGVIANPKDVTITWTNPSGSSTTWFHLQVIPFNSDGPGVDLIIGDTAQVRAQRYVIPAPVFGQGPYILLPDMTYTWRVRTSIALVPPQEAQWTAFVGGTFHTDPVRTETIGPISPPDKQQVSNLRPTLTWTNSDRFVFYYEVQVSTNSSFSTDPGNPSVYWELIHTGSVAPQNSYTVPAGFPLQAGQTYHWRVRPRIQGDGKPLPWSKTWTFRTP